MTSMGGDEVARLYVCTKRHCGRVVRVGDDEIRDWLIARRTDDPAKVVVRCPQHVTERTLRYAGRQLSKDNFRAAKANRIKDDRRRNKSALLPGSIIEMDADLIRKVQNTGFKRTIRKKGFK